MGVPVKFISGTTTFTALSVIAPVVVDPSMADAVAALMADDVDSLIAEEEAVVSVTAAAVVPIAASEDF